MDKSLPPSSTTALARSLFVCPTHGVVHGRSIARCDRGDKAPYDLHDPSEFSTLHHLRNVAKSQRTNVARFISYPLAALLLFYFLSGFLLFLGIPPLGEVLAKGIEKVLRRLQKSAFREVDARVL